MQRRVFISPLGMAAISLVVACVPVEAPNAAPVGAPDYKGVETRLLDDNMVRFRVVAANANRDIAAEYAKCAAAQYTLIRGYGFARHVRTGFATQDNEIMADAVYLVSPSLPRGVNTIDAEVVAANCALNSIPMV